MKKILLLFLFALGSCFAYADGFASMEFNTSDGTTHSIAVKNLSISFADGMMIASNGNQTLSLPLADLSTMSFAGTSAITDIETGVEQSIDVLSVSGATCGRFSSIADAHAKLSPGIYIARSAAGKTFKIIVTR